MELVILAAGMGSRFGGLKQIEPIDADNNFIIDYSIFDALASGFNEVTFIIRKENEKTFKETIGSRIESKVKVNYVFQENNSISDSRIPNNRTKPLGTAHAILCCKNVVKSPFMIINADDFYGSHSYKLAAKFIEKMCTEDTFGCIAYEAGKTITDNGAVKRGICKVSKNNITGILESSISRTSPNFIDAKPLNGDSPFKIKDDTPVSMNMFILHPSIFNTLEIEFDNFLSAMTDPMKDEYLLPDVISKIVKDNKIVLKLISSDEKWYGVTYPDDKKTVVDAIKNMIDSKKYPKKLWN